MNVENRNRLCFVLPALLCISGAVFTTAHAATQEMPSSSSRSAAAAAEDPVSDLMRVLDEETAIATRTKLNIDFVPGMVTVLHGKDLLAKGIRTVHEALALVPGVELSMAGDGQYQFLMRGMGKTFASTKIKFLINGVDLNSTLGPVATVRIIPMEQVDRIEVVRGPGSAIYGEHALAGVVDVITLEHGKDAFIRYGDIDGTALGVIYGYHPQNSKFGLSMNIAGTNTDGGDVMTGQDRLAATSQAAISNAPGLSNERESNNAAMFKLNYGDLALYVQHMRSAYGDHFGVADVLPEESSALVRHWDYDTVEVRNAMHFGSDTHAEVRVAWAHFLTDTTDQQLYPRGFQGKFQTTGVLGGPHYEETRTTLKSSFEFPLAARHYGVAGAEYAVVRQGDTWNERNFNFVPSPSGPVFTEAPQIKYQGAGNWLKEGLERRIASAYVQDQYTGVEQLTVTTGVRIDHYNDVGNALTPRVGAVYQLSSHQTLKLQYSDAFRPPSFLELYARNNPVVNGNSDIKPERMHNLEAGYIYNSGQHIFRATAFATDINHIIVVDSTTRQYKNGGEAYIRGFEVEAVAPVRRDVKVDGNVSIQSSDTSNGLDPLWGTAKVLANAGVLYQVVADRFINVQYRYVGERERETSDSRSALAGYRTTDITFSANKFGYSGLSLRAGLRNIFDADVVYPAPKATYPDDYPRPGRQWWLAATYKL